MTNPIRITSLLLTLLIGQAALDASMAAAQREGTMLEREDDDEARLRSWMAVRAARSPDIGWLGGLQIGLGTLLVGGGIAAAVLQEESGADLSTTSLIGIIGGGLSIGMGIFTVIAPNLARDDFRAIPERPLTEREIGRLEGVLRRDAQLSEYMRTFSMWLGAGMGLGGLGALPVLALAPPMSVQAQTTGWSAAGIFALSGIIFFVSSLFESPAEADWDEYQRGLMPHETPTISFVPTGDGFAITF